MASILSALLRRDANRMRRAGTGRQTTKRNFVISLPGMRAAANPATATQPPAVEGTALQRGVKRDSKGMEDPEAFWRSPHGDTGDDQDHPNQQQDQLAPAEPNIAEPTPFKRSEQLARTPAAGAAEELAEAATEGDSDDVHTADDSALPMGRLSDVADQDEALLMNAGFTDNADEQQQHVYDDDEQHAQTTSPGAVERLHVSVGLSPIVPSALDGAGGDAERHSMGTSPMREDQQDDQHQGFDDDDDSDRGGVVDAGGWESDDALPPPPPEDPVEDVVEQPKPKTKRGNGRKRKNTLEKLDPTGRGIVPELPVTEDALLPNGGGRSRRQRFRPLEFWRGERVHYGRRDSAKFEAIVDVTVAERESTPPHFRAAAKRKAAKAAKSSALVPYEEGAAGSSVDPLADAVDAMASDDEVAPIAGRLANKKKAKKAKNA